MKNSYDEIVELEPLDHLLGWDTKLVVRVQSIVIDRLRTTQVILGKYTLEVIPFGFQGYYPVIGVQYLKENSEPIGNHLLSEYKKLTKAVTINELIEFDLNNRERIAEILNEIDDANRARFNQ